MTDSARAFTTIGVIGLGTMGAGIAEVFARNGYDVIGVEVNDAGLERGRQHLEHSTGRAVKREKMTHDQQFSHRILSGNAWPRRRGHGAPLTRRRLRNVRRRGQEHRGQLIKWIKRPCHFLTVTPL